MNQFRQTLRPLAFLGGLAALCLGSFVGAQEERDPKIENIELELALKASQKKNAALRGELVALEKKLAGLGGSLAAANADAELVRSENAELRKEMEALGINALDPTAQGLRNHLKDALAGLEAERASSQQLSTELLALAESVRRYRASAIARDPGIEKELDKALSNSSRALGLQRLPEMERPRDEGAKVVATREELQLVVLNYGTEHGARIGMPLRLMRKERHLGEAIIVDVRDNISGAVIQNLVAEGDGPKVGDLALVNPNTFR